MKVPITLEELFAAANLASNKVPGKDGIPVEFYLATWGYFGPILLEVLREGIANGSLHP